MPHSQDRSAEVNRSNQKRRAHKKSRGGCGNCKLRRVKCDEFKPTCRKCSAYGVSCNYDLNAPDLQMALGGTGTTTLDTPQVISWLPQKEAVPFSLRPPILADIDSDSLERLFRFQKRTVLTVGNPSMSHFYQSITFELACCNPFLMHFVQALTASHDRHLSVPFNHEQTAIESYHLSRGCALFNQKLSCALREEDRDPLWSCASLLGAVAFSWVYASRPEDVWPLSVPKSSDLEWLSMSESKMVIFTLCDPLRPSSIFKAVSGVYLLAIGADKNLYKGTAGVPTDLAQLCEMDESSTAGSNPYCQALHILAPLLQLECEQKNIINFLRFIAKMHPDYKLLLKQKDPRALLILAYWYSMVRKLSWWIERRALLEGQAICMYLERYHAENIMIQKLLQSPKSILHPVVAREAQADCIWYTIPEIPTT